METCQSVCMGVKLGFVRKGKSAIGGLGEQSAEVL
jgi:hypothetical protein